ncbi:MAG: cadherin-like beta sandwich domain-containing protein [Bacilli bacterium]|nr:cadherin-like beta sandwich domain-containing protein [Bacilli bacterium]
MRNKTLKLLLFMFIFLALPVSIKADVKFSLTKSDDNLKPGSEFTVTVKAEGATEADTISGYNLTVTYDTNRIQYAEGASSTLSDISSNGSTIYINSKNWAEVSQNSDFEAGSFKMRVPDGAPSGSGNITLSVADCKFDGESAPGKCSTNSTSVTVAAYGTDASLSSLKIPNTTLKPAFSSENTNYTATIKDITELSVNATATDSNAKVQITDNYKKLQKGENKIEIVVTSEDGNNQKVYTVVVTLEMTPTDEELMKANAKLKKLEIKNFSIDFDQDEKKYYLTVPYKTTSLDITAVPVNEKAKVKIDGNKKLIVGKNTVKISITSEDTKDNDTYQILVTRKEQDKDIVKTCPDTVSTKEWIIFSISMLVMFTLGIVLGYFLCKKDVLKKLFKKKEKVEIPVEVETMSDTIDLSETVKEVKKQNTEK